VLEGRADIAIEAWRGKNDFAAHAMIWIDGPLPMRSRKCL